MDLKELKKLKLKLESLKTLTTVQEELLKELKYLEDKGVIKDPINLYESVSHASSSCKVCGRPY